MRHALGSQVTSKKVVSRQARQVVRASEKMTEFPPEKTIDANTLQCINAIRFLAIDAVEKANSGHPGLPMVRYPPRKHRAPTGCIQLPHATSTHTCARNRDMCADVGENKSFSHCTRAMHWTRPLLTTGLCTCRLASSLPRR